MCYPPKNWADTAQLSTAQHICSAALKTPHNIKGEICACVASSPFPATRLEMEVAWWEYPFKVYGKGMPSLDNPFN